MKVLKYDKQINIIKTNKFNTLDFILIYPCENKVDDSGNIVLMRQNVLNTCKDYPTEQEFKKEIQKRFIISYNLKTIRLNKNLFIQISLTVPDPKKVKSFDLEKAFEFFMNMIYNPNVENNEFNHYQFNREKDFIKESLENASKNIYEVGYQNFLTYVDDNGILKNNLYHNRNLLEDVTPESLYEFYNKNIIHNEPLILVYGNIDENSVEKLFSKYIDLTPKTIEFKKNYNCYLKPKKEIQYIEEGSTFKQSALYMGYKILNMKEEDTLHLGLLTRILDGSENNLIFNALRLEHNLIYNSRLSLYPENGLMFIETYLKSEAKEEAIEIIKNTLQKLYNKDFVKYCLDKIIISTKYNLIRKKDSKYSIVSDYLRKQAELGKTEEEIFEQYEKLDIDKFITFMDRVTLDTVYFLRGENNEK